MWADFANLVYVLAQHPEPHRRLREECASWNTQEQLKLSYDKLDTSILDSLTFLDSVIKEAYRWSPTLRFLFAKTLLPIARDTYIVPDSWRVALPTYTVTHHETLYQKPQRFVPDRIQPELAASFNFTPQGPASKFGQVRTTRHCMFAASVIALYLLVLCVCSAVLVVVPSYA